MVQAPAVQLEQPVRTGVHQRREVSLGPSSNRDARRSEDDWRSALFAEQPASLKDRTLMNQQWNAIGRSSDVSSLCFEDLQRMDGYLLVRLNRAKTRTQHSISVFCSALQWKIDLLHSTIQEVKHGQIEILSILKSIVAVQSSAAPPAQVHRHSVHPGASEFLLRKSGLQTCVHSLRFRSHFW